MLLRVLRWCHRRDDVPQKQESSFEANCKHIAKFAVKENVADTHPSVVTLAFGRGAAPKLVRHLLPLPPFGGGLVGNWHVGQSFSWRGSQ